MAEDGHHIEPLTKKSEKEITATTNERNGSSATTQAEKPEFVDPPMSPRDFQRNPFSRAQTSLDVDDYFVSATLESIAA
jgi:hypothetical protein